MNIDCHHNKSTEPIDSHQNMSIKLVFIGPPGAGKGTQAEKLRELFGISTLGTGDMMREKARKDPEMAAQMRTQNAKFFNDLVINMVTSKISEVHENFLLDGFPRNVEQAVELDNFLKRKGWELTKVISFNCKDDTLKKRIAGRFIHVASGRIYHEEFNPPMEKNKDNITREELQKREQDTIEILTQRLASYKDQTEPLLNHYEKQDLLYCVDAEKTIEEVFRDICKVCGLL